MNDILSLNINFEKHVLVIDKDGEVTDYFWRE